MAREYSSAFSSSFAISNDLFVSVFDTISVADAAHPVVTPLNILVFDTVSSTDVSHVAVTPLVVVVADSISVAEFKQVVQSISVAVHDSITVATALRIITSLNVHVYEVITVASPQPLRVVPGKKALSRADVILVRDSVKAQMYIGGGLGVRVYDAITVQENPFFLGYHPGTGGVGDLTKIDVGPNPGAPPAFGTPGSTDPDSGLDYWLVGI